MKLASYRDGSRDGQLVVVSRDLASAHYANGIATRLQQVLDDWNFLSPQLEDLATSLNHGKARHAFAFDPAQCMAPLPRAGQWVTSAASPHHLTRIGQAEGREPPEAPAGQPLMGRGASDHFLGPCQDAVFASAEDDIDFEAGLAAITGDVALGASPAQALEGVRLLMLANDWTLRRRQPGEATSGWGLLQCKPATAFSPVAITPDELGEAWQGGRVHLPLLSTWNGRKVGDGGGTDMSFHFGQLIAHLARTRSVSAGSIVGSGPLSPRDPSQGFACVADARAAEIIAQGEARTGHLQFGDTVRIEMTGRDGSSLFGAINQTVSDPA
jgi:fumarylacetoacetate (FAA) hydrolase